MMNFKFHVIHIQYIGKAFIILFENKYFKDGNCLVETDYTFGNFPKV